MCGRSGPLTAEEVTSSRNDHPRRITLYEGREPRRSARGWPSPVRRWIANPVVISPRGFKGGPDVPGPRRFPLPAFRLRNGFGPGPIEGALLPDRHDSPPGRDRSIHHRKDADPIRHLDQGESMRGGPSRRGVHELGRRQHRADRRGRVAAGPGGSATGAGSVGREEPGVAGVTPLELDRVLEVDQTDLPPRIVTKL